MTFHNANLLGSENASFEFGVCFCTIRKRVRYWHSNLSEAKVSDTNFIGALAALHAMCKLSPAAVKPLLAKKEVAQWKGSFETWHAKYSQRKVNADEYKANVLQVLDALSQAAANLPEIIWVADVKKDLQAMENSGD